MESHLLFLIHSLFFLLTRKLDFQRRWELLVEILKKEIIILDVDLMIKLRFSPPSWKVWKAKFLEYAKTRKIYYNNFNTDKRKYYEILYDKKLKDWSWNFLGEFDPPYNLSKTS